MFLDNFFLFEVQQIWIALLLAIGLARWGTQLFAINFRCRLLQSGWDSITATIDVDI